MRKNGRNNNELREIKIIRNYTKHAEGSVLVEYGDTKVICNATITPGVPRFLKGQNQGWLTAEYGMLPRATNERVQRECSKGRQSGRTLEIQRLIGRSLRNCIDLTQLNEVTIYIDCDVIQADGGTRTASITGSCVALSDAIKVLLKRKKIKQNPMKYLIAAVSVGVCNEEAVIDLDYLEDSTAETDMNVVMNERGEFIEIQGTAEGAPFRGNELNSMINLAKEGIKELIEKQRLAIER